MQQAPQKKQNVDIFTRFNNALAAFRKTNNDSSLGLADGNGFLKFGSKRMPSTWTTPEITDEDFYTGYGFAVVNKRANRSVTLGKKFLYTDAKDDIVKKANENGSSVTHPYLTLIKDSTDFAERDFWYDISTYLDLEGIYYLMAVRTVTETGKVGNIQKFSLMNPYWVRQVTNQKGDLGGYVENNPHLGNRIIAKELIIPIRLLNPFDPTKAYSLADAARDSQFTMKQANDFARESINGNLNAPGILSSAIELPDDQFDNFVSRIKDHGRGEPLFGNGSGTVSWVDMQTDLDKAALDKINSINRDALLAVSGISKSGLGVEEAGAGREVSKTQKDDFTENAIMPQIENIIDALNLDYRRFYADQYKTSKYVICLDNPLETDRDAEKTDVEIRDAQFTLLQALVAKGYDYDIASKYAKGLISVIDLGEPSNPPTPEPTVPSGDATPTGDGVPPNTDPAAPVEPPAKPAAKKKKKNQYEVYEGYPIPVLQYLGENADQINPISEKGSFVYSSETVDKTVTIKQIEEVDNALIGVVDDTTFIKLGTFRQNADKVSVLAKLNKRYTNQPVAIKKKINLDHSHSEDVVLNAAFDKQAQLNSSTNDLLTSAQAAEDSLYNWFVENPNDHPNLDPFINSLTLPFAVYFTVMFPIYASHRIKETADSLGINDQVPVVAMTEEVKQYINEFSKREATSHINTLNTDLQNALAIIKAKTSDPAEIKNMFEQAYAQIRARRSATLANSAAVKIFNMSQYEADLQFLTRAGLITQAYKVLFSLTGDPCEFCAQLISESNANPVPFTDAFATVGQTLEVDGKKMKFDYEDIIAGNVHPNCHCAYKLIVKDDVTKAANRGGTITVDKSQILI